MDYKYAIQHRAVARYRTAYPGKGDVHAEGTIVGFTDAPTFIIVTDEGRTVPWRCDLTEIGEPVSDEEVRETATRRRLRDGRAAPPDRDQYVPRIEPGMSLLEVVNTAIAAGCDLSEVVIGAKFQLERRR